MIYADNAATTKLDLEAFETMKNYLLDDYGNASQPYSFSSSAKEVLKRTRRIIASSIGARPEEIFFTSCGTESDNWAIKCASMSGEVVTSVIEHHAILNPCIEIENKGQIVKYVSVDERGIIDLNVLKNAVSKNTKLVSIMLANNEIGTIQPVTEISRIAHENGALFHTDAVQAVGHININVDAMGIDLLSASAHKFNGPKGIGFLYVRKGINIEPLIKGGAQELNKRAGTENIASIAAMGVALENNINNLEKNTIHLHSMEERIIEILDKSGVDYKRNGSVNRLPGSMSLSFRGCEGEAILHLMDIRGICISTGSACDSKRTQLSHVIKAIGVPLDYAEGTVRISLGKNNTIEEADIIGNALVVIVKEMQFDNSIV